MNYDQTELPAHYDRARGYSAEVLETWMDIVYGELAGRPVSRILDLGCGTGRFTAALAQRFDVQIIGADPSVKMLAQARSQASDMRIEYIQAAAEALPLPDAHVDVIFMSMVFHHFAEPERVGRECRRVLRAGGSVLLRTPTRERADSVTNLRFFPGARALYEQRIPPTARVVETFERAGFTLFSARPIEQELAANWRAYVERVALKGDSILASLSEQDFGTGLRALRLHATLARPEPIRESIDWFVFR